MPTTESVRIDTASPRHLEVSAPAAEPVPDAPRGRKGRLILLGVGVALAVLFFWKGLPMIHEISTHVETDDAYVTGEPSAVGSRITEVARKVLVKDNDYVERGDLLVALDRDMLQIQVDQKRADLKQQMLQLDQLVKTVETNRASLDQARDMVGMAIAGLLEATKGIDAKQDQVRYRIAVLRGAAASLRAAKADLSLAQKEFDRVDRLVTKQSATQSELDQRRSVLDGSRERVKVAEQQVQQVRAQLAIGANDSEPDQIPSDLERSDSEVRRSVATGQQILAQLGVRFGKDLDPGLFHQSIKALLARPEGWIDQIPSVREAQGKLDQTLASLGGTSFDPGRLDEHPTILKLKKELEEAELKLSYTEIRAPISGYVSRKSVNPGDQVQAGQALLAIHPLESVYIVANFKETQLNDILIGQPVEIYVDAYPKHPLRGRVSGFSAATGAASSLLPPENATGNFVKVVQRLPVRIDLVEPNPRETPLFVGMSVVPSIDIAGERSGPDSGGRLRSSEAARSARTVERPSTGGAMR